ncbi:MAG: iron ABC transporter substrate-binding protein [Acidimicrobiales bacterium]|nr:iron ABC transporter substrate-binding protein [Acidimicrobiales bacterium]
MVRSTHKLTAALLALAMVVAACGDGSSSTSTTTGEGGGDGEKLVVYSGRNENFVNPVIDKFQDETGIEVEVRYGDGTSDLATTILNEGDTTDADVFWAQDPAWIGAIGDEGLLATLPDDVLSLVPERYRDADGRWVGVTGRSRVFIYNPNLVTEDELPQSVYELTDPKWKGRIGVAPTNASFIAFVSTMELVDGTEKTREWLQGLVANDVQTFSGNGAILQAVDAGDLDAGLVNHYYLLGLIADQGSATARNHFLAAGDPGALVAATGVGVLEPSDNKEAAVEFIRYLLSEEAQRHFAENLNEYGLIEGAPTPKDQKPLSELAGPDINLSDLADHLESAVGLIAEVGLS